MDKKTYRAMKRPDAFQKKFFRAMDWAVVHKKRLGFMSVVASTLIVASLSLWFWERHRTQGRQAELATIDGTFSEEERIAYEQREKLQKSVTALEEELKKGGPQADTGKKSELEAKKKEMEELKSNHSGSIEKYLAFYQHAKGTPEGSKAALSVVQDYLKNEKFQEAAQLLQEVLTNSGHHGDFFQIQVRSLYTSVLEELGQFDAALEQVALLTKAVKSDDMARVLLVKGRLEHFAGKKEASQATFDQLLKDFATSNEATKARALKAVWK